VVVGAALALALKVPSSIVVLGPVSVFLALAFGFEANAMRRRALERRGYPIVDYVVAANVEQAEQRFFERWATESQVPPAPPAPRPPDAASRQPYSGLGLFSEQGG
jgi:hypothetical protein